PLLASETGRRTYRKWGNSPVHGASALRTGRLLERCARRADRARSGSTGRRALGVWVFAASAKATHTGPFSGLLPATGLCSTLILSEWNQSIANPKSVRRTIHTQSKPGGARVGPNAERTSPTYVAPSVRTMP